MKHFDEEHYEWLCKIHGHTTGYYYKGRQEALERIDDIMDYCRNRLKMQDLLGLLDIAYPHKKESESNK